MAFAIEYSEESLNQLRELRAFERSAILGQIRQVLSTSPMQTRKARVKRLRQPAPTEYRLKVGEYRIFYDIVEDIVDIRQILSKTDSVPYLEPTDDAN